MCRLQLYIHLNCSIQNPLDFNFPVFLPNYYLLTPQENATVTKLTVQIRTLQEAD